jgi:hypothetical protein
VLYDRSSNAVGLRSVSPDEAHAYPIRSIGPERSTYVVAARAFFAYYEIPTEEPTRRVVRAEDGVLVIDLNDPGRVAVSNRNRAKLKAQAGSPVAAGE